MEKLAGGKALSCGHTQVLSEHRMRLAAAGYEQSPVFCVECGDWSNILPDIVDTSANDVLQLRK